MLHIYGTPLSSPTNKVRYIANYLGISHEYHNVNLSTGEQKNPDFLKINPFGKVPAINDNGFYLSESNTIIRYLANKQQSILYPNSLQERARVDQWMDYAAQHVALATSKIMWNTYFYKFMNLPKDERSLQDGYTWLGQQLPILEKQLFQHDFIAGKTITLADFSLLAALDVCELIQIDLNEYPHVNTWRKKLMGEAFYQNCHESYKATLDKFMSKMNVV